MQIALDFDNVLADTMNEWIAYYNQKYHQRITKTEITFYSFWGNNLPITKNDAIEIFKSVWAHWRLLPPTEIYLTEKIKAIQEFGIIDIVTSVVPSHFRFVRKWLKKHEIPLRNVIRCESGEKVLLPYDVYIEDSPSIAKDCITNGKNCLIYDQPWNRNVKGKNVNRIYKLSDACDVINKYDK